MDIAKNILIGDNTNSDAVNEYVDYCRTHSCEVKVIGCESHHILCQSEYPQYKSFVEYPWNEAVLTPYHHVKAHILLYKAKPSIANARAVMCTMATRFDQIDNISEDDILIYQKGRIQYINSLKSNIFKLGIKESIESRKRKSLAMLGKPSNSKGHISKYKGQKRPELSAKMIGVPKTEEQKARMSSWQKGLSKPYLSEAMNKSESIKFIAWSRNKDKFMRAQEFYDIWSIDKLSSWAFSTSLGFDGNYMQGLVPKFKSGWIPKEDINWIKWFDQNKII